MSETFENGDRVEDGKQGEVVGPATSESHKGKGVWPCASPATRARSNASSTRSADSPTNSLTVLHSLTTV